MIVLDSNEKYVLLVNVDLARGWLRIVYCAWTPDVCIDDGAAVNKVVRVTSIACVK